MEVRVKITNVLDLINIFYKFLIGTIYIEICLYFIDKHYKQNDRICNMGIYPCLY